MIVKTKDGRVFRRTEGRAPTEQPSEGQEGGAATSLAKKLEKVEEQVQQLFRKPEGRKRAWSAEEAQKRASKHRKLSITKAEEQQGKEIDAETQDEGPKPKNRRQTKKSCGLR